MRCRLRPCTSARANVLWVLLIEQSSTPQTTQDAMHHSGASLRPQRRPQNATRHTAPLPPHTTAHSATRRATVFSICRYLRHRSAVAQRFHHYSISTTAVFPAPGISNIAVSPTPRYFRRQVSPASRCVKHRGISGTARFPTSRYLRDFE